MGMVPDNTVSQLAASCQGKAWERSTKVTIKARLCFDFIMEPWIKHIPERTCTLTVLR